MDSPLENEQFQQLLIFAIVFIFLFPVVIFIAYGIEAVEVFSVIVSSILSLGLIILYFRQQSTLETQTRLMNREYISNLHFGPYALADSDEIIFELKNNGRGRVQHIQMESEIVSDTSNIMIEPGETTLTNRESGDFELEPDSDYERYSAKAKFTIPSQYQGRGMPFTIISNQLSHKGIDSCQVVIRLKISDESLESPHVFEIADQEIATGGAIEDGIEHDFSSDQDINKRSFEDSHH
ncbi:hypothetical protein [Halorubrum kocurii]|uniref:hypothetical protein n=1 Tax=Halorubrum kocurii TaxID=478441 RepID=UPI0012695DF6|nr:hypothetical protein [Halorubrum kocurii]